MAKTKKKETPPCLCERCGHALTPSEIRVYHGGIYGLDYPDKQDKRKMCFKCKREIDDSE